MGGVLIRGLSAAPVAPVDADAPTRDLVAATAELARLTVRAVDDHDVDDLAAIALHTGQPLERRVR